MLIMRQNLIHNFSLIISYFMTSESLINNQQYNIDYASYFSSIKNNSTMHKHWWRNLPQKLWIEMYILVLC